MNLANECSSPQLAGFSSRSTAGSFAESPAASSSGWGGAALALLSDLPSGYSSFLGALDCKATKFWPMILFPREESGP